MSDALDKAQRFLDEAVNLLPRVPDASGRTAIVGLMGYAQSGKDTTAQVLTDEFGFTRIAFADALRDMLYALNPPIIVDEWVDSLGDHEMYGTVKGVVDSVGWDEAKTRYRHVRILLQRLGTEAGRNVLGQSVWVDAAMRKVKPGGRYVFTDVRFPNEVTAVRDAGGLMWRVVREGTKPVNAHASETAADDVFADVTFLNNGTVEDLHRAVREVARGNGWK